MEHIFAVYKNKTFATSSFSQDFATLIETGVSGPLELKIPISKLSALYSEKKTVLYNGFVLDQIGETGDTAILATDDVGIAQILDMKRPHGNLFIKEVPFKEIEQCIITKTNLLKKKFVNTILT